MKKYSNSIGDYFSIRSVELLLIDTAIVFAVWQLMKLLTSYAVGSMLINGVFSFTKILTLFICLTAFRLIFQLYTSVIRYADSRLYVKMMLADTLGGVVYYLFGRFVYQSALIGFSYTLITTLLIMCITIFSRLTYQMLYAYLSTSSDNKSLSDMLFKDNKLNNKTNVAIVGAGNIGASLASELLRNPKSHYNPVMFIDNDPRKINSSIHGIRVYPEDENIVDTIKKLPIQEIVIAIPESTKEKRELLYNLYKETSCVIKIYDYPLGETTDDDNMHGKRQLREFSIEDLLFRDPINVKSDVLTDFYKDKTILVTGGGGSIGSELCRQIAKLSPKHLVIIDIYENNAYDIQQELIRYYGRYNPETKSGLNLTTIIASVRDVQRLDEIFNEVKPQIVFHAAAHKHVPLMEDSGCEAIKNNVIGTYNVANAAEKYGVEKFLLISTDKAVNPTNIMGASKRLCEMVIQCRNNSKTEFTAVRFGNVLGSNGSVIPLFKRQIENGGPVTITDKRIIRYFMTIPEAVGLVMETCCMARNGELYVLDMGKPVHIIDLAENMIKLSGLKPYEDIDIIEIGLRPGEKLYEELLMKTENLDKTENDKIFIERDQPLSREQVEEKLSILKKAFLDDENGSSDGHREAVIAAIKATVPTYHDPEELNKVAEKTQEMSLANFK